MVEIFTDGSSSAHGKGTATGWAYIIVKDGQPRYSGHGGDPVGTNNTAELKAAIQGLTAVSRIYDELVVDGEEVVLVSDSRYVLGMASGQYSATTNLEQVGVLRALFARLCTSGRWVRGHAGNTWNERCDSLAGRGRKSVP